MIDPSDDLLEVRGLSATLPPNQLEMFDLEIVYRGRRYLLRLSDEGDRWKVQTYHQGPGKGRTFGKTFSDSQDRAVVRALITPLMDRLTEEEMHRAPHESEDGTRESPEDVFGALPERPRPATLPGPPRTPEDSEFVASVLGPGEPRPYKGGELRLLSVEFYREGVTVQWLTRRPDTQGKGGSARRELVPATATLMDGTGRRYQRQGGSAQIGLDHARGYWSFLPGVDEGATQLKILIGRVPFVIQVPRRPRDGDDK